MASSWSPAVNSAIGPEQAERTLLGSDWSQVGSPFSAACYCDVDTPESASPTALSLAFVSGWFTFEIFVKTGFGEAELRQKVVLSLALLTATALVLRKREPRMTA